MPRSRSPSRSRSRSLTRSRSPLSRSPSMDRKESLSPEIKDEDLSPFLIRVFVTKGRHTPLGDFDKATLPLRDEFQVYGSKQTSPSDLIRSLYPSFPPIYRSPQTRFHFKHIYVDASPRGLYRSKDLTSFIGRDLSYADPKQIRADEDTMIDDDEDEGLHKKGGRKIQEKTLDGYGFITGDFISVSLSVPEPRFPGGHGPAAVAIAGINGAAGPGGRGGDAPREGGWNDRRAPQGQGKDESEKGADAPRWGRGGPLPPQGRDAIAGRGARGEGREREPLPEGRWGRGGQGRDSGRDAGRERDRSRSPSRGGERWQRRRD
ncbi:histone deacetylase complex subunit [Cryptococcus wingfieldii CBS 7118]|uniref:Histone deacetylase complex subunit n=1 Tax=Cryptococcus wingfieldii CBS 7118 TaxID=1295528 RepID=A0A1E3K699_9TREE|nr:histone deacetylase complex subunit [Cryptococcus wingfieldii CBS 7118]ODO08708.1 histone deacetylase complex subunit [Cryptococcus wingfieldii CBS 7118]